MGWNVIPNISSSTLLPTSLYQQLQSVGSLPALYTKACVCVCVCVCVC